MAQSSLFNSFNRGIGQRIFKYEVNTKDIEKNQKTVYQPEIPTTVTNDLKKEDFQDLLIIGQFNLGFIISQIPSTQQLLIVDQHASAEITNFEYLMDNYEPSQMRHITPIDTPIESEDLLKLIETNVEAFERNGYVLEFYDTSVGIVASPECRKSALRVDDFLEMTAKLANHSFKSTDIAGLAKDIMCDRVYYALASKACRSSIMIGDHLSHPQMEELVSGLSKLDKPWMCPHGRPTFRFMCKHPSTYMNFTN